MNVFQLKSVTKLVTIKFPIIYYGIPNSIVTNYSLLYHREFSNTNIHVQVNVFQLKSVAKVVTIKFPIIYYGMPNSIVSLLYHREFSNTDIHVQVNVFQFKSVTKFTFRHTSRTLKC